MECQVKSKTHSNPATDPEMFTVKRGDKPATTQCLAHAAKAERRGDVVNVILT